MPPTDRGGGIIRVAHNKDNPYTPIHRGFTEDGTLSWPAVGVMAYLLCKPDNWTVKVTDLIRRHRGGRDAMRKILKELEATRYLVRTCHHDPATGRWKWESVVYETPCPENPATVNPAPVEPATVGQGIERVVTEPTSDRTEYRGEPPPRLNGRNPSAFAVQAGTAPSRPTPPGERR